MMTRQTLGELLVDRGIVSKQQIEAALAYQKSAGKPLGEILMELGFLAEDQLVEVLASQQHVETWDLLANPPSPDAVSLVAGETCVNNLLVPVRIEGDSLTVAMRNPGDLSVIDRLSALTKKRICPVQVSDTALASILSKLYGSDPTLSDSVDSLVNKALSEMGTDHSWEDVDSDVDEEEETRPVIGLVDQIINDAIALGASDIHIEPRESRVELRYRINGTLVHMRDIPSKLIRKVVARVKIMADLDITIRRHPQDGRIEFKKDKTSTDLRISCLPTQFGTRVTMRIHDRTVAVRRLDDLGFNDLNAKLFRKLIRRPYGIVLLTGPTGSGKTTTLYAAVNEIKDGHTNFMTCEDPIEYSIDGINQSQVDEKSGLTFAVQLRSILRQDPDTVLVGEIRDAETAETAIRAAMTGHLVLSTVHCNDAASVVPRLINMGIDPFLLSTSLCGVVSQRLLRVLCPDCKEMAKPTEEDVQTLQTLGAGKVDRIWTTVGCEGCYNTGYKGRVAVHEVMPVSESVASLIAKGESTAAIRIAATEYGYRPMSEDALTRVLAGQTTLSEARRLVAFDDFERVPHNAELIDLQIAG